MKTKILAVFLVAGSVFAQNDIPPDAPWAQKFSLSSNIVATATTNGTRPSTNTVLLGGVERATFWSKVQGGSGATASNSFIVHFLPYYVTRASNVWTTNFATIGESPITVTTSPQGSTAVISAETYDVSGIEGFVAQQINVSGGTITNECWITYRKRPQ